MYILLLQLTARTDDNTTTTALSCHYRTTFIHIIRGAGRQLKETVVISRKREKTKETKRRALNVIPNLIHTYRLYSYILRPTYHPSYRASLNHEQQQQQQQQY